MLDTIANLNAILNPSSDALVFLSNSMDAFREFMAKRPEGDWSVNHCGIAKSTGSPKIYYFMRPGVPILGLVICGYIIDPHCFYFEG